MEWRLCDPLTDVQDVVVLADSVYGHEADEVLGRDRELFRKHVTLAAVYQAFDRTREFLGCCYEGDRLLGYCWYDRGGYTTYSREEISNAKFHHIDLSLPAKRRVRILNEMIDQHILWAGHCGVPVICSTSIRGEHDGFMRIHAKRGFKVAGSYAWGRTEELLKGIHV